MIRDTETLTTRTFDVAVIGGGIHGACAAWDAALRGLSTVLVERDDFGGGTSANSLKIMHGGLRYLQDGNLRRARSSSRERAILLRIAPHLVKPLRFLIPIYAGGKHGGLVFRAGLALNDCVSWDRNRGVDTHRGVPRGRVVSREEALRLCPWLSRDGLRGGATWYDGLALTSERLTLAFLQGAAERGATVVNYAESIGFLRQGSRIVGLRVEDRVSGEVLEVRARATINATGPRLEKVVSLARGARPDSGVEPAHLAKAINLVWRSEAGDMAAGVFSDLERRDDPAGSQGRYLFVVPWNGCPAHRSLRSPRRNTLSSCPVATHYPCLRRSHASAVTALCWKESSTGDGLRLA